MINKNLVILLLVIQVLSIILFMKKELWQFIFDYESKNIIAIAYLNNNLENNKNQIKGSVYFYEQQDQDNVLIDINLSGLPKDSNLGFHIHAAGDLSDGCTAACAHFNPFNTIHGGPNSRERHVGDLGNIKTDANGICKVKFTDSMIKLRGYKQNIIGRSIVIHGKEDDLGKGGDEESLKTGNAGKRIACAVIGYAKKMCV